MKATSIRRLNKILKKDLRWSGCNSPRGVVVKDKKCREACRLESLDAKAPGYRFTHYPCETKLPGFLAFRVSQLPGLPASEVFLSFFQLLWCYDRTVFIFQGLKFLPLPVQNVEQLLGDVGFFAVGFDLQIDPADDIVDIQ